MFATLITKHINNRQKNSVHVKVYMTSLPLWVKRRCAKPENLPTQKSYSMYIVTILLNF